MTESDAYKIGISFLKNRNQKFDNYGDQINLGGMEDHTIFYSSIIGDENGGFYLGGHTLLIDKRTAFCLMVASSPNFYSYDVRLFRIMKLRELYDDKIDIEEYKKKRNNLHLREYVNAIFLLLTSHSNNLNAFLEFLEILNRLEEEPLENEELKTVQYRALTYNPITLKLFCEIYKTFKQNPAVVKKVNKLEKTLLKKSLTINALYKKYNDMLEE